MEDLKNILARHGFSFKKKFGQNFLTDTNLLSAIVHDAGVDETVTVLEIGAGAGALTRELSRAAKKVVAYEIDASLQPVLAETLSGCENTEVVFGDILRADLPALEAELGRYRVVANLPYYVTTPVLMRFLEEAHGCDGLTVMVQEEVADRFCAQPGTAEYGAVTAAIALKGAARVTRKVPRTMFTPRPNVDSAVVRIDFEPGRIPVGSEAAYRAVVRCAFSSRRKTLENNLMSAFRLPREQAKAALVRADIPDMARGETLSPQMLARLADVLQEEGVIQYNPTRPCLQGCRHGRVFFNRACLGCKMLRRCPVWAAARDHDRHSDVQPCLDRAAYSGTCISLPQSGTLICVNPISFSAAQTMPRLAQICSAPCASEAKDTLRPPSAK